MEPNTPVVITDIDMPFGSMVKFMVKWTFATIPAAIIVGLIFLAVYLWYAGVSGM